MPLVAETPLGGWRPIQDVTILFRRPTSELYRDSALILLPRRGSNLGEGLASGRRC